MSDKPHRVSQSLADSSSPLSCPSSVPADRESGVVVEANTAKKLAVPGWAKFAKIDFSIDLLIETGTGTLEEDDDCPDPDTYSERIVGGLPTTIAVIGGGLLKLYNATSGATGSVVWKG